jgi:hypothetical protein
MLKCGRSICTRVTPLIAAGAAEPLAPAASSSFAAARCTFSMGPSAAPGAARTASRSFCAASGKESTRAVASSLSEYSIDPKPHTIAVSSTAAPIARGMRQRCILCTAGDSA